MVAVVAAWFGVVRRGITRVIGIAVAVLALLGALALLFRNDGWPYLVWLVVGVVIWHTASRMAFRVHVRRPAAEPPRRPVLFINPWSGDGKAAKVGLAEEAAKRGIKTVELHRGDDLEQLVHDAVSAGADALAAAGGDGTQAIVATAAAAHGLPYACIPAGTRNHFALDLGVDRDDVVGALDAFVDGGEHLVDLGEVNGRVFVNNVSMGPVRRGGAEQGLPQRQDPHLARHRGRRLRPLRFRARPAVGVPDGAVHALRRRSWCAQASSGWLSSRPEWAATGSPSWADCSGNGRRWTDTGRGQMAKFGKRMTKFAKSPKGQKLLDKAMRKAKDPKTRAKLEKKFGRKK